MFCRYSGIEAFIFAKYTQRKYIAREWVPPKPNVEVCSYC